MPNNITFAKASKTDSLDIAALKSITPLFYWCSAHEFVQDEFKQNKYLFQYQQYSVDNSNIRPSEVKQLWCKNKNEIRSHLINFLDLWDEHKRILFDASNRIDDSKATAEDLNHYEIIHSNQGVQSFSSFANFVGKSIFDLKYLYIEQASAGNYDGMQKDFWKQIALLNGRNNPEAKKRKKTKPKNKKTLTK